MFCPNCGKDDQKKNAYCRNCGEFLPDFDNIRKRGFASKTPEENIKTSLVLNFLSSVTSIVMAILLYATHLGKENVNPIIYASAALFTVIGIWQMVDFVTILRLRQHFQKRRNNDSDETISTEKSFSPTETRELLNEPNMENVVPASVTERTTKNLSENVNLSKTEH